MNNHKTKVTIFNQTFEISSQSLNAPHLQELAAFVDQKMRTTFQSTKLSSALKVAVLTALNLAEELVSLKKEVGILSPTEKKEPSINIAEVSTIMLNFIRRIDSLNHQIQLFNHHDQN